MLNTEAEKQLLIKMESCRRRQRELLIRLQLYKSTSYKREEVDEQEREGSDGTTQRTTSKSNP